MVLKTLVQLRLEKTGQASQKLELPDLAKGLTAVDQTCKLYARTNKETMSDAEYRYLDALVVP